MKKIIEKKNKKKVSALAPMLQVKLIANRFVNINKKKQETMIEKKWKTILNSLE